MVSATMSSYFANLSSAASEETSCVANLASAASEETINIELENVTKAAGIVLNVSMRQTSITIAANVRSTNFMFKVSDSQTNGTEAAGPRHGACELHWH